MAYKVGISKQDFIPVASKMNGAGKDDLGVIGAVVMEFSCKDINGDHRRTKQLCYVCTKLDMDYLSRGALISRTNVCRTSKKRLCLTSST